MSPLGGHLTNVMVCATHAEADSYAEDEEFASFLRIVPDRSGCLHLLRGLLVGRIVASPTAVMDPWWPVTLSVAQDRRPLSWSMPGRHRWERLAF